MPKIVKVGRGRKVKENRAKLDGSEVEPTRFGDMTEEEVESETLSVSRPKTASDQRRILHRDPNPDHSELLFSARRKLESGDDELSHDEMTAYIEEERHNLKRYGKVKLTPIDINTKKAALQKASVKGIDDGDTVRVTMFETIDPAPQVGTINVPRDYGYEKLEKGQTYLLPYNVAMVLAEGRKGAIHE